MRYETILNYVWLCVIVCVENLDYTRYEIWQRRKDIVRKEHDTSDYCSFCVSPKEYHIDDTT
jgi:hypothetical protein